MGYRLNRLDEPVFMAVPKPMLTEFGIHYRLESCDGLQSILKGYSITTVIMCLPPRRSDPAQSPPEQNILYITPIQDDYYFQKTKSEAGLKSRMS